MPKLFILLILFLPVLTQAQLLSWVSPTTNTDGTPLTDLKGFRVGYEIISKEQACVAPSRIRYWVDMGNSNSLDLQKDSNFQQGVRYFFTVQAYTDKAITNIWGVATSDNSISACATVIGPPPVQLNPIQGSGEYGANGNDSQGNPANSDTYGQRNYESHNDPHNTVAENRNVVFLGTAPIQADNVHNKIGNSDASVDQSPLSSQKENTKIVNQKPFQVNSAANQANVEYVNSNVPKASTAALEQPKPAGLFELLKQKLVNSFDVADGSGDSSMDPRDGGKRGSPIFTLVVGAAAGLLAFSKKKS